MFNFRAVNKNTTNQKNIQVWTNIVIERTAYGRRSKRMDLNKQQIKSSWNFKWEFQIKQKFCQRFQNPGQNVKPYDDICTVYILEGLAN